MRESDFGLIPHSSLTRELTTHFIHISIPPAFSTLKSYFIATELRASVPVIMVKKSQCRTNNYSSPPPGTFCLGNCLVAAIWLLSFQSSALTTVELLEIIILPHQCVPSLVCLVEDDLSNSQVPVQEKHTNSALKSQSSCCQAIYMILNQWFSV